jgi:hypothetical protein
VLYSPASTWSCLGLMAIPPIWSHLYGGRLHLPLLLTGLVADAAAAFALYIPSRRGVNWKPSALGLSTGNATIDGFADQAWRTLQVQAPALLMVAAAGIRLTAGIYDTSEGWIQAKDYNRYRAVRRAESPVAVKILPTPGAGISLALAY